MFNRSLFSDDRSLLIFNRSLLFSKRSLLLIVPSLGILGARGARGAGTFSKLYTRARSRIMRARETRKKWVQNSQTLTDWYGL